MKKLLNRLHNEAPWNKGKLLGQKAPLTVQEIWSIRMRLQDEGRERDLALFNLAIDSKLRACDLLQIRLSDVASGNRINKRAMICQQKTGRAVRFEITPRTRKAIKAWTKKFQPRPGDYLFPSRLSDSPHLSIRRIVMARLTSFSSQWISSPSWQPWYPGPGST